MKTGRRGGFSLFLLSNSLEWVIPHPLPEIEVVGLTHPVTELEIPLLSRSKVPETNLLDLVHLFTFISTS